MKCPHFSEGLSTYSTHLLQLWWKHFFCADKILKGLEGDFRPYKNFPFRPLSSVFWGCNCKGGIFHKVGGNLEKKIKLCTPLSEFKNISFFWAFLVCTKKLEQHYMLLAKPGIMRNLGLVILFLPFIQTAVDDGVVHSRAHCQPKASQVDLLDVFPPI